MNLCKNTLASVASFLNLYDRTCLAFVNRDCLLYVREVWKKLKERDSSVCVHLSATSSEKHALHILFYGDIENRRRCHWNFQSSPHCLQKFSGIESRKTWVYIMTVIHNPWMVPLVRAQIMLDGLLLKIYDMRNFEASMEYLAWKNYRYVEHREEWKLDLEYTEWKNRHSASARAHAYRKAKMSFYRRIKTSVEQLNDAIAATKARLETITCNFDHHRRRQHARRLMSVHSKLFALAAWHH